MSYIVYNVMHETARNINECRSWPHIAYSLIQTFMWRPLVTSECQKESKQHPFPKITTDHISLAIFRLQFSIAF